jgi:hypothetical protein
VGGTHAFPKNNQLPPVGDPFQAVFPFAALLLRRTTGHMKPKASHTLAKLFQRLKTVVSKQKM